VEVEMSFYNFDEIKAANAISEVAERLGLNMNKSGASLRGKCPACESGGNRNLVVTPGKEVYFCFSEGKGGDVLQLISHVKGIGVKDAAQWLAGPSTPKEKTTKGETPSEGFKPLDYLQHDHEAVIALGFEPDDADRIGLGYAPRGMMKGLVTVPIRLTDGRLVGYIGISEAKLPTSWKW
jgi:DNA primase